MRTSRGFTLVEAMIGMVILAVIVAGALSFFMLWSSRSAETFRYKTADEAVATAVSLITTDIRKAGFGCTKTPEYAIFAVDNGGANPDELYLNYGDYLTVEGDIRAPTSDTLSVPYRSINSVFMPFREFTVGSLNLSNQAKISLATASNFQLRAIPEVQGAIYPGIGAVIASAPGVADVDISTTTFVAGPIPGTQNWTFPLVNPGKDATGTGVNLTAGMTVAPAISYKVIPQAGAVTGALWRNRGKNAAPFGTAIMGGSPYVDVTDFQVRLQFADTTWDSTNSQPANVRLVEVTISYRVMISKNVRVGTTAKLIEGWGPVVQRQFRVSPRSVALNQL
jgi:prepilin-type N-terminal cleavage/methylation domain-containing protein